MLQRENGKKTSSLGELNLYSLLAAAAAATNIISFERSTGRLWDTVRVTMGAANQLPSNANHHSSTRKQQWNTRSVRKVERNSHRHETPVFWSAAPQKQPANSRAAFMPCYKPVKAGLGSQCFFLVSLEVSWTKQSCQQGSEISPAGTTKLKIRNQKLQCWTTGDAFCGLMDYTGTVIIKDIIHLPALLHLLTPMHCALGLPGLL